MCYRYGLSASCINYIKVSHGFNMLSVNEIRADEEIILAYLSLENNNYQGKANLLVCSYLVYLSTVSQVLGL